MADCEIPKPMHSRRYRRLMAIFGSLVILGVTYVASIGPLAFLESRGYGSEATWECLHAKVYRPVYHAWWYGPKSFGTALGCYTAAFEPAGLIAKRFGSEFNNNVHLMVVTKRVFQKQRRARLEWEKVHPQEARAAREFLAGCIVCLGPGSKEEIDEAERNWWRPIPVD